jgi:hypothetical protein
MEGRGSVSLGGMTGKLVPVGATSTTGAGRPADTVIVASGTTSTSRPGTTASGAVEVHPPGP